MHQGPPSQLTQPDGLALCWTGREGRKYLKGKSFSFKVKRHPPVLNLRFSFVKIVSECQILSHYLLGNLYRSLDEDAVVSDVIPLLDLVVRDELGVAEAQGALVQRVAAAAGLLEVLPVGVGVEGLRDVLGFGKRRVALVQDGESHLVGEGPLQQAVVLSG